MGSLEAHEKRLERRFESDTENAFQSKTKIQSQKFNKGGRKIIEEKEKNKNGKYPPCNICERKGHLEKDCWFKGKPQCRNCKKFGHVEKSCHLKQNYQANFSNDTVISRNFLRLKFHGKKFFSFKWNFC